MTITAHELGRLLLQGEDLPVYLPRYDDEASDDNAFERPEISLEKVEWMGGPVDAIVLRYVGDGVFECPG